MLTTAKVVMWGGFEKVAERLTERKRVCARVMSISASLSTHNLISSFPPLSSVPMPSFLEVAR
jgi:hypothetical protein